MTPLKLAMNRQFSSTQIIEFLSAQQQQNVLIELITRPRKYELSVRIEVVLNDEILHPSSS